jgi:hypothetical protein
MGGSPGGPAAGADCPEDAPLELEGATSGPAFYRMMTLPWAAPRPPRPVARPAWLLGAALLAAAVAWWVVTTLPPMHVRVGGHPTRELVPPVYQMSVFPAFAAFVAALALDALGGHDSRTWRPRAALVLATGMLAIVRLGGWVPFSGHGLFLAAVLAYEVTRPAAPDAHVLVALVVPGLLVAGWYKLVVWGDPWWFVASLAAGAALGVVLARRARG